MKWVWIVLGSLAGLIALAAIIGAMLPVNHVASRRARFRETPEPIWPSLSPGVSLPRFRQGDVDYDVVEAVPNRRLVTRIADKNLPYGGSWIYEIEPDGTGSTLRITERGEVYNPFFRFMSRFIMGHTATIDTSLHALGKKLGEDVHIEN
jgi:hypothetical protein